MSQVLIVWTERADAAFTQLAPAQAAQVANLIAVLKLNPRAGHYYRHTRAGHALFIVNAWDMHVLYRLVYRVVRDELYIIEVMQQDWEPQHPGND